MKGEGGPFTLEIPADGWLTGDIRLETDRWHTLKLTWQTSDRRWLHPGALLEVDGHPAARRLGLARAAYNGLSYLHLVSLADAEDAGLLIDRVSATRNTTTT